MVDPDAAPHHLIRNVAVALPVLLHNVLKLLGLRPARPNWVAFELREDPPYRPLPWRIRFASAFMGRRLVTDIHTLSRRFDFVSRDDKVRGVLIRLDGLSTSGENPLADSVPAGP